MSPRPLSPKQRKLLTLQQDGASDETIARELSIHVGTVRLKRAALRRGMTNGAYSDLDSIPMPPDLFSQNEGCAA